MQTIWNERSAWCFHPDLFWDVLVSVDYQQQTPKHLQQATCLNDCGIFFLIFSDIKPREYFGVLPFYGKTTVDLLVTNEFS